MLGAAGATEAMITLLAMRDTFLPPDDQPDRPRPGVRSRLRAQRGAGGGGRRGHLQRRSGSAATTPASSCASGRSRSTVADRIASNHHGRGGRQSRPTPRARGPTTRARSCGSHYREEEMVADLRVCTHCGYHFPVTARGADRAADRRGVVGSRSPPTCARPTRSAFVDSKPYTERLAAAELGHRPGGRVLVGTATIGGLRWCSR